MARTKITGEVLVGFAEHLIEEQIPMRNAYVEATRQYWAAPFYKRWFMDTPRKWDYRYNSHAYKLATDIIQTVASCGPQVEFLLDESDLEYLGVTTT